MTGDWLLFTREVKNLAKTNQRNGAELRHQCGTFQLGPVCHVPGALEELSMRRQSSMLRP